MVLQSIALIIALLERLTWSGNSVDAMHQLFSVLFARSKARFVASGALVDQ
jgi:hypothetical protein